MDKKKKIKMREEAICVFELTKGFTTEPTDVAMKTALEMAGYVLELTNDVDVILPEKKTKRSHYSDCEYCFSSDTFCIKQTWDKIFACNDCGKDFEVKMDDLIVTN